MTRRLFQLFAGLALYGLSIALIVRADLGLDPWDVLNQGVFEHYAQPAGISFGLVVTRGTRQPRQNVAIYRQQLLDRNRVIMRWRSSIGVPGVAHETMK